MSDNWDGDHPLKEMWSPAESEYEFRQISPSHRRGMNPMTRRPLDAMWYVGVAKHPDDFGRFPKPEKPDYARGVWSFDGPTWICDCTDFRTATDVVEGHNAPLRPQTAALTPDGAAEGSGNA